MQLILASASPRRLSLLRALGAAPLVHVVEVDESVDHDEPPAKAVVRLARAKAEAAVGALPRRPATILAAVGESGTVLLSGMRILCLR